MSMQQESQIPPTPEPAPVAARRLTPYITVWSGLAVIAAAYISVALAWPGMLGAPNADQQVAQTTPAGGLNSQKSAEDKQLAEKLARMEQELAESQSQPSSSQTTTQTKSHLDRIAALEAKTAKAEAEKKAMTAQKTDAVKDAVKSALNKKAAEEIANRIGATKILNAPNTVTNVTDVKKRVVSAAKETAVNEVKKTVETAAAQNTTTFPKTPAQIANQVSRTTKPAAKPVEKKVAAVPKPTPKPKPAPTKVVAKKTSQIKTGSINRSTKQPISFGPAVVTRANKPIGVRLATGPSVSSLQLSWSALSDRHGATVRGLQPRYITGIDATGLTYDLIAGPFNSEADAVAVCARLHANGARCTLGEYTGNALN